MSANQWGEDVSQTFIDFGRYFVPEREQQIAAFVDLIPVHEQPFTVLELCSGEGLLASALLERFPSCTVYGLDGSPTMLDHARQQLAHYGDRFRPQLFDLADSSWRRQQQPVHAVVSSLTIHHLDDAEKQQLFHDMAQLLEPDGVLLIADVIAPASRAGAELAAKAWDAAVRRRALEIDGNLDAVAYFEREQWNMYRYPDVDGIDKPARLLDQLKWLEHAGFADVDVFWMQAGHALFGGRKQS
ncbi:MAG: methyltransferase domain-containing protein [Roseiflexaceae bacterium]